MQTAGPNGLTTDSGVDFILVGPSVSLDYMDIRVLDNQAPPSVDLVSSASRMASPLHVSQAHLKLKGKINVSNQFAALGDPVLEEMDDIFDGVMGIWESERQIAQYYHDYGFKPSDFVFEKWSPKLKEYFSHLTKNVIKDQGVSIKVIEVEEDDEVASETDESSRFMKIS
ncbi:hypothetical protein L1987_53608 [Smallanthus sonchifolius]|uniref:Uncharacterized protein n=1 Tax=Smallanthus sonchifolius TaxID=185202 RepID=A0ACB9EWE4_9ASTR|nr:hypothetical protein L1987_53608 [Smallanthus sonchifolius]